MSASVEIANFALSHLGIGKEISSFDEKSAEASACDRFYDVALEAVLRDFAWPFATKIDALALVEEDPNDEWSFSYRYPSDCLHVRRILSGTRNDTRQSRVPYRIIQDDEGLLILTDLGEAEMEYTLRADDPVRYPPDFKMAFSFRLAAYIAPRITSGDRSKMREQMLQLYAYEISAAKATAGNEEQPDELPDSEFIRARD